MGTLPRRQPDEDHNTARPGPWRSEWVTVLGLSAGPTAHSTVTSRASRANPSRTRATRIRLAPGSEIRILTVVSPARAGRITFARFHVADTSCAASDARHGQLVDPAGTGSTARRQAPGRSL